MTMQLCETDDTEDTVSGRLAEDMQRTAYTGGWLWGVACGFIAGGSFVGMAVWLVSVAAAALACPSC